MNPDTRQIERLRWNIRTVRQYVLKALDELESQVDALGGSVPEGQGDWKKSIDQFLKDAKKGG